MDIRNCKRCGRIYTYDGFSYCRKCRHEMDEEFEKVKEYLRKYPGASISEVEAATGVDEDTVMNYVKDGRLEMDPSSTIEIYCEKCGERIFSGRYCDKCTRELSNNLSNMVNELKKNKGNVPPKRIKNDKDDLLMRRGTIRESIIPKSKTKTKNKKEK